MAVRFSVKDLSRRFVGRGGTLQFATYASSEQTALALKRAAVGAMPEMDYDGDTLDWTGSAPTPGGPVLRILHCDSGAQLEVFLTGIAQRLEAQGLSGRLVAAGAMDGPRHWFPSMALLARVGLDWDAVLDSEPRPDGGPWTGWWVDSARTEQVLEPIVDWCLEGPGDAYIRIESSSWPTEPDNALKHAPARHGAQRTGPHKPHQDRRGLRRPSAPRDRY